MGTLVFWGVIVVGIFLGIIIFSLLSMAQKAEEFYDHMPCGDKKGPQPDTYCLLASGPVSRASRGEVRA
jgi:hypothetical protein